MTLDSWMVNVTRSVLAIPPNILSPVSSPECVRLYCVDVALGSVWPERDELPD